MFIESYGSKLLFYVLFLNLDLGWHLLELVFLISEYSVCSRASIRAGELFLFRFFVRSFKFTELFNVYVFPGMLNVILDGFLILILSFSIGFEVKLISEGLDTWYISRILFFSSSMDSLI